MVLPDVIDKITYQEEKKKNEYFFAIQILDEGVKSAIWTIEGEKPKVVALGNYEAWDRESKELISAVDKSLSSALERFIGDSEEPSKVIFGLPDDWISDDRIKKDKQELLSELCRKLDLKPIGFVSIFDALNFRLKEVEGIPPSVILVGVGKKMINLAVVQAGKIEGVEKVFRSENLGADVYEGLLRFSKIEILPSRMLLFNGEGMEEASQILISFPWQTPQGEGKRLPFLHFPKVEILPYDFDIVSIVVSGGKEVAKSLGFMITEEKEILDDLGFVKGEDIVKRKSEVSVSPPVKELVQEKKLIFGVLKERLSTIRFPKPLFPKLATKFPLLGAGLGGVVSVLLFAIGVFWWNVPRARVIILVTPKVLEKEQELTVDPNQEVLDLENLILPAQVIESEISGERTAPTTGEKTVGEPARGEIIIYNRTDSKKIFPAGTVIVGPGNLKFTLDREVTVASKTPDLATGVDKWGEAKVEVTAVDIGAQYNLASNSQFSFKDFPTTSYLAKNESSFFGGTSRQIQVVSEEDQKNLQEKLLEELKERVQKELLAKTPPEKKLIEEGISLFITSASFDHKIGDEAQILGLKLKIKVSGLAFSQNDFIALSQKVLDKEIPQGFGLKKEEVSFQFEIKKKNEDGSILFKTLIHAALLPKIDQKEIIKNIKGRYEDQVKKYLSHIPGYVDSEISISPKLPWLLGTLPRRGDKITLEIRSKE